MTHRCRYCWPNSPHDFPGDDGKTHWYKTSPHDDRWGSFNPFNMDWWGNKFQMGCLFFFVLVFVAAVEGVVEWVFQ